MPVIYNFNSIYHSQAFIPWLIFLLAFVALKENRTIQAAWILAPIVFLAILYSAVMCILRMDTASIVQLNHMFKVIIVGFAIIWLFAERIAKRNRLITFMLANLIYLGYLAINLIGSGFGKDIVNISCLAAISIPAIICAFAFAAIKSTKPFKITRFLIYYVIFLFVALLILFCLSTLILMQVFPFHEGAFKIGNWIAEILTASFFAGLIYFVCLVPFIILLSSKPFWRKRFETIVR
jgi:hypothetical protein